MYPRRPPRAPRYDWRTMSQFYQLDFEKPVVELEQQIEAAEARLRTEGGEGPATTTLRSELEVLRERHRAAVDRAYAGLTPWNTVRVSRHPNRPQTRDYIALMCRDFAELHGDRRYGDDAAIVTGFARIGPVKVMVVGHQKGKQTAEKLACNFGCAHPEGYRKALAKMALAEKYGVPIVT